ncbi:MAG: guanylate kinase [candidate division Zixibacteria bacterium]|nr:guanylate kinase [candidate division Zixibacteria bacterium]
MMKPGLAVVISSPSGTGKTTICRKLLEKHDDFQFSVSATTRPARQNERDGIDYFFMTENDFSRNKKAGNFIETAKYLNHWYGTPIKQLKETIAYGKVVLLDIDIQGGKSIKKIMPDAVAVFLMPPSMTELKRRLKKRLTETTEAQKKRIETAAEELKSWTEYDYITVNNNLNVAVEQISMIIKTERLKTKRLNDKQYWKKSLIKLLGLE